MDSDGSGYIEITEFVSAAVEKTKLLTEKNVQIAFDHFN